MARRCRFVIAPHSLATRQHAFTVLTMLVRLILGLIVIVVVIAFMRHARRRFDAPRAQPALDQKTAQCVQCGVYFPRQEAVIEEGRTYCTKLHAERGRG